MQTLIEPKPSDYFAHPDGLVVNVRTALGDVRVVFPDRHSDGFGKLQNHPPNEPVVEAREHSPEEVVLRAVQLAREILRSGRMEPLRLEMFVEVDKMRSQYTSGPAPTTPDLTREPR